MPGEKLSFWKPELEIKGKQGTNNTPKDPLANLFRACVLFSEDTVSLSFSKGEFQGRQRIIYYGICFLFASCHKQLHGYLTFVPFLSWECTKRIAVKINIKSTHTRARTLTTQWVCSVAVWSVIKNSPRLRKLNVPEKKKQQQQNK